MGNAILEKLIQCSSLRIIEIHIHSSACEARPFCLQEFTDAAFGGFGVAKCFQSISSRRVVKVVKGEQEQWRELYVNAQAYDTLGI